MNNKAKGDWCQYRWMCTAGQEHPLPLRTDVGVGLGGGQEPGLDALLLAEAGHDLGLDAVAGDVALVGQQDDRHGLAVGQCQLLAQVLEPL